MSLPEADLEFLAERAIPHELVAEGQVSCMVLPSWQLPEGYQPSASDLLIRLLPGYPDIAPDMWWFSPPVAVPGTQIPGTDLIETYLGRSWQRWSRHFQAGQWQSGIDGLESYLALIAVDLARWTGAVV